MIYFYDGSKEAFYTAFLLAYPDEEAVLTSGSKQLGIGQKTVFVRADPARAKQAERRLEELDPECVKELDLLLRSGQPNRDTVAFGYFKLIAARGGPVRRMLAEDAVIAARECMQRVRFEIHRFHGFLRFMESACGALYAPVSPDNDICDLLVPHFRARLPQYPFVIHDVKRRKAAVYDGANTFRPGGDRALRRRKSVAGSLEKILSQREYPLSGTPQADARLYARPLLEISPGKVSRRFRDVVIKI